MIVKLTISIKILWIITNKRISTHDDDDNDDISYDDDEIDGDNDNYSDNVDNNDDDDYSDDNRL